MVIDKTRDSAVSETGVFNLREWMTNVPRKGAQTQNNVVVECGWGRLIFAQTYDNNEALARAIRAESEDKRDIALYVIDPHVLLALAPQEIFLDPSHTYRIELHEPLPAAQAAAGVRVRAVADRADAEAARLLAVQRGMVPASAEFIESRIGDAILVHLVAEDLASGAIVGAVTGVDHGAAFADPMNGASLWCLAVDPQAVVPGVGKALVLCLAALFREHGRRWMDLSVMHDNREAIALYENLGFERLPLFCVKRKNPINERLYIGPQPEDQLNVYAQIIVNEARRRGIAVDVLDAESGYFNLSHGGRSVSCRESLCDLTSAVAMSCCDDKAVTRRLLCNAGLHVPDQRRADDSEANLEFLRRHKRVVVKPARGEQGVGISVDVRTPEDLDAAVKRARTHADVVLIEQFVAGDDIRVIVIDYKAVAAAVRRPPAIVGTGRHTVKELIEKASRRRTAATSGESRIPMDAETRRCVVQAGYDYDQVLPEGESLTVRKTANLHTGGTIHDITADLNPALHTAAERAARILELPVVGLDFLAPDLAGAEYVIIEANERPGLANHEPQPTAERFVDLLFPHTVANE